MKRGCTSKLLFSLIVETIKFVLSCVEHDMNLQSHNQKHGLDDIIHVNKSIILLLHGNPKHVKQQYERLSVDPWMSNIKAQLFLSSLHSILKDTAS